MVLYAVAVKEVVLCKSRKVFRKDPQAVSYTHLTLPTNREV